MHGLSFPLWPLDSVIWEPVIRIVKPGKIAKVCLLDSLQEDHFIAAIHCKNLVSLQSRPPFCCNDAINPLFVPRSPAWMPMSMLIGIHAGERGPVRSRYLTPTLFPRGQAAIPHATFSLAS